MCLAALKTGSVLPRAKQPDALLVVTQTEPALHVTLPDQYRTAIATTAPTPIEIHGHYFAAQADRPLGRAKRHGSRATTRVFNTTNTTDTSDFVFPWVRLTGQSLGCFFLVTEDGNGNVAVQTGAQTASPWCFSRFYSNAMDPCVFTGRSVDEESFMETARGHSVH